MNYEFKEGDRVSTPYLDKATVLEYIEKDKWSVVRVMIDGASDSSIWFADSLRLHDPEAELERILIRAEWSESSDALMLAGEVRSLRARLEAVCDVVSNAVAFGDHPEPGRIMEAVLGE